MTNPGVFTEVPHWEIYMKVYSERGYTSWASWLVLFEWEDVFARKFGTEVIALPNNLRAKLRRHIRAYIHKLVPSRVWEYRITDPDRMGVLIIMDADGYFMLPTDNIIPIYLDFSMDVVDQILRATPKLPAYFVACMDIYDELVKRGSKNVHFIPQCVSDRYYSKEIPVKDIDMIQIGRRNPVLHEYALKYCEEHPGTEYIYQSNGGTLTYISTTRGEIGRFAGREEFVDMMRRSRISLVSTPRSDGCRDVFGGADLVTARFYESAVFYCRMIGRYTPNRETETVNLSSVCPLASTYEDFARMADEYLASDIASDPDTLASYRKFIEANLAGVRAEEIMRAING